MKITVITGASSGLGKEFALQLAERKDVDEIWVIARRAQRLQQLAQEIEIPVRVIAADLTDEESLQTYSDLLQQHKPEVRVLVNCSGYGKFGRYDEIPLQEQLGMIDLNCKALVSITAITIPYMGAGGRIVQVDSMSAFTPVPYLTVYAATKAFVLSYTRGLNAELAGRDIRAIAVCPGWVQTEFFDRARQTNDSAINYFNVVYQPRDVVRTALRDTFHTKKDVSIHGLNVKCQIFAMKVLPHRLIMKIWKKQQGL